MSLSGLVVVAAVSTLLSLIAYRLMRSVWSAALVVALLLSAPVANPELWSGGPRALAVACMLGWLLAMLIAVESDASWGACAAGAAAGGGVYAHAGAMLMMPALLLIGAAALLSAGRSRTAVLLLLGGFLIVAAPRLATFVLEPAQFSSLVLAHRVYDASRFNPLQGAREVLSWVGLAARSEAYYAYFDPARWFLSGGSVREHLLDPQVFPAPFIVLVPAGIYSMVAKERGVIALLVIGGLLTGPLPNTLLARPPLTRELLWVAPLVTVLAVHGATYVASRWHRSP